MNKENHPEMAKPKNGLKSTQRETLQFIQDEGSCTATELAEQFELNNSTASQRLRQLKNGKYASKKGDRFMITPKGKSVLRTATNKGGKSNSDNEENAIEFENIEFESNKNGSVTISVTVDADTAAQIVADQFVSQIQEAFANPDA